MTKHTLFVCKTCNSSSEEVSKDRLSDGTRLLEQLNTLFSEKFPSSQLKIQPVGCMWACACSQGCVVAVSSSEKPTYFITDLSPDESATGLLKFIQLYIRNGKGVISYGKLKKLLQSANFSQIPRIIPFLDESAL
ncbi:MAG: DUF1636 family protein [Leptolyngbyaceae cyanobacterium SU_3_3]|nr:DUF1636 family protein [Leptolyngbyaceae cyanobacterium SU_3_3]